MLAGPVLPILGLFSGWVRRLDTVLNRNGLLGYGYIYLYGGGYAGEVKLAATD